MSSPSSQVGERETAYKLPWVEGLQALLRIGGTPKRISTWALRWIDQPNSSLTNKDWHALRCEISALSRINIAGRPDQWEDAIRASLIGPAKASDPVVMPLATRDGARRFLSMVSDGVQGLIQGGIAAVGPLRISVWVVRADQDWLKGESTLSYQPENIVDEAVYKVLLALQACGGRVGRCNACSRLFLADRTNQTYCSTRCQSRVTSRDKRRRDQAAKTPKGSTKTRFPKRSRKAKS